LERCGVLFRADHRECEAEVPYDTAIVVDQGGHEQLQHPVDVLRAARPGYLESRDGPADRLGVLAIQIVEWVVHCYAFQEVSPLRMVVKEVNP
jgi:hypothetical protein